MLIHETNCIVIVSIHGVLQLHKRIIAINTIY